MSFLELDLFGGFHVGPLFVPNKVRAPQPRMQSTYRSRVVAARTPPWADRKKIREMFRLSRELTKATAIQHSVDHIVPLNHPLVCGLHNEFNLCALPLVSNVRKSNNHWPDMPFEQMEMNYG